MRAADILRGPLADLEAQHLLRTRRIASRIDGRRVRVDGKELLCFCSNDYLGLASHPAVADASAVAARRWGAGSGASHLVSGHGHEHQALEEELAAFVGRERAVLFSTGYMANLGAVTSLIGRGGRIAEDRLNHASLIDAGILSGARFSRYAHADATDAARVLGEAGDRVSALVTDGVFSMDGDLAPLPELAALATKHGAWLMVDDAHGLGVLGATGRGILEHFALGSVEVPVLIGTLGKAFGSFGAFVAGDAELCDWLVQKARSYIYTTALPPAIAAATRKSLLLVSAEQWRREHLREHVMRFRAAACTMQLNLLPSDTPIQPLIVGSAAKAVAASQALETRGLWVSAIRPPTVPAGSARLRITFSAVHTAADIDRLCEALRELSRTELL
jgi:8-amino-7-oxononanoate synthase